MQDAVKELLHFDPLTVIMLAAGLVAGWHKLRTNSAWHTAWIKRHSDECDEYKKQNSEILVEMRETNARLTVLTESHHERIGRLESQFDRAKGRV